MSEETYEDESLGRIEVAPDILASIAHYAIKKMEGIHKLGNAPADVARMFRRDTHIYQNGVLLDLTDGKVKFDIYVIMKSHVNIMETSRALQEAIAEAIDTMVGIPVEAVNIRVVDVVYSKGEAV